MAHTGYACLLWMVLLGLFGCAAPWIQKKRWLKPGPWLVVVTWGQVFLACSALMILIAGVMGNHWTWSTVFQNSHTDLALIYKFASIWSSPEGSFLVWIVSLCGVLWCLARHRSLSLTQREKIVWHGQWVVGGSVLCFLISGHPFEILHQAFEQGRGLNPLLEHPYLLIHPPFLYMGYASTLPLFCLGCSDFTKMQAAWRRQIQIWSLISWAFLTTGITLGSYWAYTQLGWGGWWFWDPVENGALIPWLLLTGLIHGIQNLDRHKRTMRSLCLFPFMAVQIGIWGVRSGVLVSVHSFAQDTRWSQSLGLLMMVVVASGIYHLVRYKNQFTESHAQTSSVSDMIHPWAMLVLSGLILCATFYPVVYGWLYDQEIVVGLPFYHHVIVPFCLVVVAGSALGPLMRMPALGSESPWRYLGLRILPSIGGSILSMGIMGWLSPPGHISGIVAWGVGIGLLIATGQRLWIKRDPMMVAGSLVHVGLGVCILGMAAGNWHQHKVVSLALGQVIQHEVGDLFFEDIGYTQTSRSMSYVTSWRLMNAEKASTHQGYATLRYHPQRDMWTAEAEIFHGVRGDLMIVPETLINTQTARFSFQFHPLIWLIWCGAGIMIIGAWRNVWVLSKQDTLKNSIMKRKS